MYMYMCIVYSFSCTSNIQYVHCTCTIHVHVYCLTVLLGDGLGIMDDGFIRGMREGELCCFEMVGNGLRSVWYESLIDNVYGGFF